MFKGFKNKSILKSVDSHLQKRQPYTGEVRLKKLAVLIDARYDIDILSVVTLANKLGVKPKDLKILGLKEAKSHKENSEDANASYFDENQLGYTGEFKSKSLKEFVNENYDVLINFYTEDIAYMNLVAAASKAKFKAGHVNVDNRINDLVISTDQKDKSQFIKELTKYLKIFKII